MREISEYDKITNNLFIKPDQLNPGAGLKEQRRVQSLLPFHAKQITRDVFLFPEEFSRFKLTSMQR